MRRKKRFEITYAQLIEILSDIKFKDKKVTSAWWDNCNGTCVCFNDVFFHKIGLKPIYHRLRTEVVDNELPDVPKMRQAAYEEGLDLEPTCPQNSALRVPNAGF